jgi:hypothetical protein
MNTFALLALTAWLGCGDPSLANVASDRAAATYEVLPAERPWSQVGKVFDVELRLPETRRADGRDLVREMEVLLAARFDISPQTTAGLSSACCRRSPSGSTTTRSRLIRAFTTLAD